MTDMEKDFNKVAEQINSKIAEAAKLLQEANKLGQDAGLEYLGGSYYLLDELSEEDREKMEEINWRPLLSELSSAGWSTSSMKC